VTSNPTVIHQLFHYTSIKGVEGIVKSKSIWATMLHFMNDSREWLYALDLVRADLSRRLTQRSDPYWFAFIAELTTALERIERLNICVCSFSAAANQLSQWRAYCPVEGGYEMGFNFPLLESHLARHQFSLQPCVYEPSVQRSLINAVIEPIINAIGPLADEASVQELTDATLDNLSQELALVAPILKHPDFKEEKEWRGFALVFSNDARMKYHIRGSIAIPHCVLGMETASVPFPVTSIMVGPNAHQSLAARGLEALVAPSRMNITVSTTPLRSF
jgi:hypothetical protein